jgi:quercetin dioxygenase-like cupin family protein
MTAVPQESDTIQIINLNPVAGSRLVLHKRVGDRAEEPVLEIEGWLPEGWQDGWRHLHPLQEERVQILDGKVIAEIGGWSRTYSAGETFIVPAGVDHSLTVVPPRAAHLVTEIAPRLRRNDDLLSLESARPARILIEMTPALRSAELVCALHRLRGRHPVGRARWPKRLVAALIADCFKEEIELVGPRDHLDPLLSKVLQPVARALAK